jgi:hypothetical protein
MINTTTVEPTTGERTTVRTKAMDVRNIADQTPNNGEPAQTTVVLAP